REKYMELYSDNIWKEQLLSAVISIKVGPVTLPLPMQFMMVGIWKDMALAHYVCNNYTWLAMAVYFQINFLQWIETSMFTIYLPIGIVLRIFPYTRGAGGFLIALAIGLYLVYPLLFLIIYANSAVPSGCQAVPIKVTSQVCASDPAAFTQLAAVAQAQASLSAGALGGSAGNMIVYGYFYPLVILVVTFAFVRTISPFLGADIAEMGRTLFKVV
ncbi:MAG: hypothetical protein NT157_00180, partial [Candidatus Micrarchaeota archaeon]|nr:hypothetical protein [Candidatus Micrarchaeota archaeon]